MLFDFFTIDETTVPWFVDCSSMTCEDYTKEMCLKDVCDIRTCQYDGVNCKEVTGLPSYGGFDGETTDFANVPDLTQVGNAVLEKSEFGKIFFKGQIISFEGLNLDQYITVEDKLISINPTDPGMSRFAVRAELSFYNLEFTDPVVLRDGMECEDCTLENYVNGIFTVMVPGFSTYTVEESFVQSSQPGGGSSGGGSSGGGSDYTGVEYDENLGETCNEDWICDVWRECINGIQSRDCYDYNNCGTTALRPVLEQGCEIESGSGDNTGIVEEISLDKKTYLYILYVAIGILTIIAIILLITKGKIKIPKKKSEKRDPWH